MGIKREGWTRHGGTHLLSKQSEGRDKQISVSLRSTWSTTLTSLGYIGRPCLKGNKKKVECLRKRQAYIHHKVELVFEEVLLKYLSHTFSSSPPPLLFPPPHSFSFQWWRLNLGLHACLGKHYSIQSIFDFLFCVHMVLLRCPVWLWTLNSPGRLTWNSLQPLPSWRQMGLQQA